MYLAEAMSPDPLCLHPQTLPSEQHPAARLCSAGLAFKLAHALVKEGRRQGLSGEAAVEQAVDTLLDRLTVEIPADDRALRITFVDRLPDLAVRVANSLVVRLLENYARQRADFFDEVNRSLQTRNADILKDLRALELTASSGAAQVPQALQQKFGILNAVYLPDQDPQKAGFYSSITPVNQFRVLFNAALFQGAHADAASGAPDFWNPPPSEGPESPGGG